MDPDVEVNRAAWEAASEKHVREHRELLETARGQSSLAECELDILRPLLLSSPSVVHLQSGHGLDDLGLVAAGARRVVGVDFSGVAATTAAQHRALELAAVCRYVVAEVPGVPLRDQCADLVYTGKGALIWMPDLCAWAADAVRLLRPAGHLFIHEAHPMVPLWTWDEDETRIRPDRSYFGRRHQNDTFPARGAMEWQWTLGEIINAIIARVECPARHRAPRAVLATAERRGSGMAGTASQHVQLARAAQLTECLTQSTMCPRRSPDHSWPIPAAGSLCMCGDYRSRRADRVVLKLTQAVSTSSARRFARRDSAGGVAAVHGERDAEHEARGRAAEPQDGRGDLIGPAEPADRLIVQGLGHVEFPFAIMSATIGVSIVPGQTALMRMPLGRIRVRRCG
jgi:SAM-dependent methyltransferase